MNERLVVAGFALLVLSVALLAIAVVTVPSMGLA